MGSEFSATPLCLAALESYDIRFKDMQRSEGSVDSTP